MDEKGRERTSESERSDFQYVLTTFFFIFPPTSIHRAAVSQRSIVVAGCREKLDTTQDVKAKMETNYSLVFLSFSKQKKGEHYPKLCFSFFVCFFGASKTRRRKRKRGGGRKWRRRRRRRRKRKNRSAAVCERTNEPMAHFREGQEEPTAKPMAGQ